MDDFYLRLPEGDGFAAAFDSALYRPVPEDWVIATTDVVRSTVAIESGRYRDVTIAGALGTIALANHLGSLDFPFFFGGDGMLFLLPAAHAEAAVALLEDTRRLVDRIAGLELRVAVIPVADLYREGAVLEIARIRVSPTYVQAVGRGDGFALADQRLKHGVEAPVDLPPSGIRADYAGFSCRWLDIPSHRGETLSLIIETTQSGTGAEGLQTILARLQGHLGDPGNAHPLSVDLQTTGAGHRGTELEARVRSGGRRGAGYWLQRLNIGMQVWMVRLAIRLQLPVNGMGKELRRVREDNIRNADVQKLDGTLKMVLAVTPEERRRILEDLERARTAGEIVFGHHVSDRAIMTCLIRLDRGFEVHFVDAADGGYAMAARRLKALRAAGVP